MSLELSLSVVIYDNFENVPHAKQVAILREAADAAIAKFEQSGELALDASLDFDFKASDGTHVDVWLARPE
jgi:hypothetical protein